MLYVQVSPVSIILNFIIEFIDNLQYLIKSLSGTGMTAGAIGIPDHWWSPIDDVVEAYFKCIYNPKLNGM